MVKRINWKQKYEEAYAELSHLKLEYASMEARHSARVDSAESYREALTAVQQKLRVITAVIEEGQ